MPCTNLARALAELQALLVEWDATIHDFGTYAVVQRWTPPKLDGEEGSEQDVMGLLYDDKGYTHETLYRRSRQLTYDNVQPGRSEQNSYVVCQNQSTNLYDKMSAQA